MCSRQDSNPDFILEVTHIAVLYWEHAKTISRKCYWKDVQFHIETNIIILHHTRFFLWPVSLRMHPGRISFPGCLSQSSKHFNVSKHHFGGLSFISFLEPLSPHLCSSNPLWQVLMCRCMELVWLSGKNLGVIVKSLEPLIVCPGLGKVTSVIISLL